MIVIELSKIIELVWVLLLLAAHFFSLFLYLYYSVRKKEMKLISYGHRVFSLYTTQMQFYVRLYISKK